MPRSARPSASPVPARAEDGTIGCMTARDAEQTHNPQEGGLAGSIGIGLLMMLVSAPILIHETRSTGYASLLPWLLAGGPILGLVLTWVGGWLRAAPNTPRAQATSFGLAAVMAVSLLLVVALNGPTGIVVMANLYFGGWFLLFVSFAVWNQRRQAGANA